MKNVSFLLLLTFASIIEALFCPTLTAKQNLLTAKLKNNSVVDIIKLDSEDKAAFAKGKEVFMKTFLEVYKEYTPEELYLENKPGYLESLIEAGFEGEEKDFNNKKQDVIFVVVKDIQSDEIIGFAAYDSTENSEKKIIYIRQLAIDAAYRKQGLGKTLILDIIKIITQNQPVVINVCTRKINAPAIEFYYKLNFQDTSMDNVHPELPKDKFCGFTLTLSRD